MNTIKNILEGLNVICAIAWPISFILTFVGLFTLDAEMTAYSFAVCAISGLFCMFYGFATNDEFKGCG